MKQRALLLVFVLVLVANTTVPAIDYWENQGDDPLWNGADIPQGNHRFLNTGADRIITITEGAINIDPNATITLSNIAELEFANGTSFFCNEAEGATVIITGDWEEQSLNNRASHIEIQNGAESIIYNTVLNHFDYE